MKLVLLFVCLISLTAQAQTTRELEMLEEVNLVRTNPKAYAEYIDAYLDYWDAGSGERKTAKELKKVLMKMKPVGELVWNDQMYRDAVKHGEWMKKRKRFDHSKMDYAENLVAGNESIRYAVIDLLIDHGVASRGHRKNILDPEYKQFAAYEIIGPIQGVDFNFVQEFQ